MSRFTARDSDDFTRDKYRWYEGEYLGYELTDGKYGPQIKWRVKFDGETREQWVYTGQDLTERTKFGKLVHGWLGVDVQKGVEVDIDELQPGTRVKVMYGAQEKKPEKVTEIEFELA